MPITDSLIVEIEQEAATTRRLLAVIPEDKLEWTPHPKSSTLGQLALHIASINDGVSAMAGAETYELKGFTSSAPKNRQQVLDTFEASIAKAKERLSAMPDTFLAQTWRATADGQEVLALPRIALIRSILMNHYYHHRGQLSVYLRLLDVPLPSIYGPSADTPFPPKSA